MHIYMYMFKLNKFSVGLRRHHLRLLHELVRSRHDSGGLYVILYHNILYDIILVCCII